VLGRGLLEVVEADAEQRGGPEVTGGDRRGSKWLAHSSSAVVDLATVGREDVPLGSELVEALPPTAPGFSSPA
jgi:hypothetical protein